MADRFTPFPADIVDSGYIAQRLNCTRTWVAEMVRNGEIPQPCTVQGTGNGRPWKFHKARIDEWLASR